MTLPTPPAPASPWAQKPAATNRPRDLGLAEAELVVRREPSGPLTMRVTFTFSISGTRLRELVTISSKRSQSSSSRRPLKSGGIARSRAGRQEGGRAGPLVAAHHQPAAVLAEVDQQVGVAQRRQRVRRVALAERLGDDELVRHRLDRDAHARQPADLRREHPGRDHHDLGLDVAALGADALHATARAVDPGDARARVETGPALARAARPGRRSAGTGPGSRRWAATPRRARRRWTSVRTGPAPARPRSARAGGRTSWPSPPGGAAPPSAPRSTRAGCRRTRPTRQSSPSSR